MSKRARMKKKLRRKMNDVWKKNGFDDILNEVFERSVMDDVFVVKVNKDGTLQSI